MTEPVKCRYYGRDFTAAEMALLRELIAGPPALSRHALSKEFCRRIGWYKTDGGLKDMMARVVMLAMHRDGRIQLPPPKGRQSRPGPIVFGPDTEPPRLPPPATLDAVRPLTLRPVVGATREGRLWNEFVARYHYLGYTTLVGAQMRYAVHARDSTPLALLGFSTAAWTLAPRDRFIGWSRQFHEKNLPLVVDNPRFVILPWIHIPNLGSHLLALVRRRLPADWTARYNHRPRADRDLRRDPAPTPAPSTAPPDGPASAPPRAAAATTPKTATTSQKGHLAPAPPEETGRASSTARSNPHAGSTERLRSIGRAPTARATGLTAGRRLRGVVGRRCPVANFCQFSSP